MFYRGHNNHGLQVENLIIIIIIKSFGEEMKPTISSMSTSLHSESALNILNVLVLFLEQIKKKNKKNRETLVKQSTTTISRRKEFVTNALAMTFKD